VQDLKSFFGGNPAIFCGSNDFSIRHYAGDVRVTLLLGRLLGVSYRHGR